MNFIKTGVYSAIVATTAMSGYANAAQETAPAFVKRISDDLVKRLVEDKAKYKKNPKVLYAIVKENIEPHVDFAGFSRGVMGRYYKRATPKQRMTFQKTFRSSLLRAYSKYLGTYDNQSYSLRPYRASKVPNKAVVTMDFKTGSGEVVPISYQLINKNNVWKVRNVKAAGIDIGLTFRKQFSTAMRENRNNLDAAITNFLPKAKKP